MDIVLPFEAGVWTWVARRSVCNVLNLWGTKIVKMMVGTLCVANRLSLNRVTELFMISAEHERCAMMVYLLIASKTKPS